MQRLRDARLAAGNTESVAGYISEATGLEAVDIADMAADDIAALDGIIAGAPTWHTGADSERSGTAWDDFLYGDLTGLDLKGKKVAIFGLGDQARSYAQHALAWLTDDLFIYPVPRQRRASRLGQLRMAATEARGVGLGDQTERVAYPAHAPGAIF